ncbi:MAG TPA: FG-GAP-like repeat-containing protein [Flavisolibacter sp.]|nr:FG-GAP-like repeat-containing protein [Flavisolibacter sp.]
MKHILKSVVLLLLISACNSTSSNKDMESVLQEVYKNMTVSDNFFAPEAEIPHLDSLIAITREPYQLFDLKLSLGAALLKKGEEQKAIEVYEELLKMAQETGMFDKEKVLPQLALAYMRLGEKTNCLHNHTAESCIFPLSFAAIHKDKYGSQKAIELYESILKLQPRNLEARWLLNIAYMTIGGYPQDVPSEYLLKLLPDEARDFKPFVDIAANLGLDKKTMAGGSIIDDFDNDGDLDIVLSSWGLDEKMSFFKNNGNGTFSDASVPSGLARYTGGLHIVQTDYNNDGFKDIFVPRGAWKKEYGREPNSLLRNNGDGTFTDVTIESGLLSFHPTQSVTWNDFNKDGWLDVFIGNETSSDTAKHPSELYINNKNGTFTNVAKESNTDIVAFIKGATSGDYDNDGWPDIFLSTLNGKKILLRNEGKSGKLTFKDVSEEAGLTKNLNPTFPTWFWDYNNDGWLDILVCEYRFTSSLAVYAAAEAMGAKKDISGRVFLFKNKHDGTFEEVTEKVGLDKVAFAMGSNFGDIDNDGYPDIFLGTGNPQYESLVPNKMFQNIKGEKFLDVTTAARVGNLQKGHSVSFADLDDDGDEDIFIKMGGALIGDAYQNSFFLNPGQNENHWIGISLEGVKTNKAGIGSRIKVTFKENGVERSVYRDVNEGGSFGANPLEQHIGIGSATTIESIEIRWQLGNVQVIKNIQADQHIKIKEGVQTIIASQPKRVHFPRSGQDVVDCPPEALVGKN